MSVVFTHHVHSQEEMDHTRARFEHAGYSEAHADAYATLMVKNRAGLPALAALTFFGLLAAGAYALAADEVGMGAVVIAVAWATFAVTASLQSLNSRKPVILLQWVGQHH